MGYLSTACKGMTEIKKPDDMPSGKAYVIQVHSTHSEYHEGDERSRTNPGHGYPAYTSTTNLIQQYATTDKSVWENAIKTLLLGDEKRRDYVAFVCEKANISVHVSVGVN